jgi:hydrogenase maturation protein HypF
LSKKEVYGFVKKYYKRNEFELLYNQLEQNFNCIETSSTGRILDAVSLLLGFCENERKYKHEPIDLLEKNSTVPYKNLKPKIIQDNNGKYILDTTYLFNYVIRHLHKDKKLSVDEAGRLAATAQFYIAQGLYEIIQKEHQPKTIFASGGITNIKIIAEYFASKNIFLNKKIPRGDAGLSFGQIFCFLLENKD